MTRRYEEGDTITIALTDYMAVILNLASNKECIGLPYGRFEIVPSSIIEHKKREIVSTEIYLGKDGFRNEYANQSRCGEKLKKVILSYIPSLNKISTEIK